MKWILDEPEARVIYSLTTDRQPVIHWATNHMLARLSFDSNTQQTKKMQVYPSDVASFPPLHEKKSHKNLGCNGSVYMYFFKF